MGFVIFFYILANPKMYAAWLSENWVYGYNTNDYFSLPGDAVVTLK